MLTKEMAQENCEMTEEVRGMIKALHQPLSSGFFISLPGA